MGAGGLMQLVAVGVQDAYIKCSSNSFFRHRYNKHTNFAVESIRQVFQGKPGHGQRVSCTLSRNGDLVTGLVMEVTMKRGAGTAFYPAEHLIKEVELEIGGQRIDLMTNTWLRLHDELYRKMDAREAYQYLGDFADEPVGSVKRFYVQIPFWFCNGDSGKALPLIALQYHEVKLHVEFESADNIPGIDRTFEPEISLWADYVFLDQDERRWFARNSHEYLIEQVQFVREPITVDASSRTYNYLLPFNHPVKFMAWVAKPGLESHGVYSGSLQGLEAREVCGPIAQVGLQLNGQDRFEPRKGSFFRLLHPVTTFGQAPSVGVYLYSFAMHPSQPWPSGSLNCSRIDSLRLQVTTKAATLASADVPAAEDDTLVDSNRLNTLEIYARNYNVLRVMQGMAGLRFSN